MALSANFVADFSSFMDATRDAVVAMRGFKDSAETLGPAADRGLEQAQKTAEQIGRGVREVATDITASAQTFIAAYAEEQEAVNKLNTALVATGQATPTVIAAYAEMAAQFQATTKYADESIVAAQATLTTIGRVGPEQMQLALTAVTNLASGMGMELEPAALMVSKAFASGGENLGKLKTILGDAYKEGMSATEMLQALNDKFGPAAQNELNTYSGQMANMNNQMSDFNEKIGKVIVDNLSGLMAAFRAIPEPIQTMIIAIVAIGTALAPVLVSIGSLIGILATPGIGAAMMTALGAIVTLLTGPVGIAIAVATVAGIVYTNWEKISGYTAALYTSIKSWLVDRFQSIITAIQAKIDAIVGMWRAAYQAIVGGSIVPDMMDGIADQFGRLDSEMVAPVQAATGETIRAYMDLMRYTNQANAILSENSLYTSRSQLDRIAALPSAHGGGGGGNVTVNNTINITDTASNLASRVSEEIMRTVRAGTQLGTA